MFTCMTDVDFESETSDLDEPDPFAEYSGEEASADTAPEDAGTNDSSEDGEDESGLTDRQRRSLIRRVASRAEALADAPADHRNLLAELLNCRPEIAALTAAAMLSSRSDFAPVSTITSISDADPLEAGVLAADLDRADVKACWSLLETLGAVDEKLPGNEMKAALALAKAVTSLDPDTIRTLDDVVSLGRGKK